MILGIELFKQFDYECKKKLQKEQGSYVAKFKEYKLLQNVEFKKGFFWCFEFFLKKN